MLQIPKKGRVIRKINAFTQARLISLMIDGVYTARELAEHTGLHYVTVCGYIRELRRAKACYVAAWDNDSMGRATVQVFAIGRKDDVIRPASLPRQEISRRYRAKLRRLREINRMAGVNTGAKGSRNAPLERRKRKLRQQENMKGLFK